MATPAKTHAATDPKKNASLFRDFAQGSNPGELRVARPNDDPPRGRVMVPPDESSARPRGWCDTEGVVADGARGVGAAQRGGPDLGLVAVDSRGLNLSVADRGVSPRARGASLGFRADQEKATAGASQRSGRRLRERYQSPLRREFGPARPPGLGGGHCVLCLGDAVA